MESRRFISIHIQLKELPGATILNDFAHDPADVVRVLQTTVWPDENYALRQEADEACLNSPLRINFNVEYEAIDATNVIVYSYSIPELENKPYYFLEPVTLQVTTREALRQKQEKEHQAKKQAEQQRKEEKEKIVIEARENTHKQVRELLACKDYVGLEKLLVDYRNKETIPYIRWQELKKEHANDPVLLWNLAKICDARFRSSDPDDLYRSLNQIIGALLTDNEALIIQFINEYIDCCAHPNGIQPYQADVLIKEIRDQLKRVNLVRVKDIIDTYEYLSSKLPSERGKSSIEDEIFQCRINNLLINAEKDPAAKFEIIKLIHDYVSSRQTHMTERKVFISEIPKKVCTFDISSDLLKFIVDAFDQIQEPHEAMKIYRQLEKKFSHLFGVNEIIDQAIKKIQTSNLSMEEKREHCRPH